MAGDSACTFAMSDGSSPIEFFARLDDSSRFREGDLRGVIEEYRTEVLDKTMYQGVDFEGNPFASYNDTRPFYYNPSPGGTVKQQKGAVNRLLKRTGLVHEHLESSGRGAIASGGTPSRTGRSIRFASYGDFKRSLGRSVVDLLGPKAPQMLMNMVVQMSSETEGAIGIYNEPYASRAEGHNNGSGHLPRRRFFDITDARKDQMEQRMLDLIKGHISRLTDVAR